MTAGAGVVLAVACLAGPAPVPQPQSEGPIALAIQSASALQALAETAAGDQPAGKTGRDDAAVGGAEQEGRPVPPSINVGPLKNVKFSGLLQVWYSSGNQGYNDTFRLRRTEMYITGDVTDKAKFNLMIDPSKALSVNYRLTNIDGTPVVSEITVNHASRIMQNAFLSLLYIPRVQLDVGQFKLPLGLEGLANSGALGTVERALFTSDRARGGSYGDVRELGAIARTTIASRVDIAVGVFNGMSENQNDLDKDDRKAVAGRVAFRPASLKGLQIGMSGAADSQTATATTKRRLGLDFQFTRGNLLLQSELMTGRDGSLYRRGYYAHVGYKVQPKIETVFRFDSWDPDTAVESTVSSVTERDYLAGFNFYLAGNFVKCQADYVRKTYANAVVASRNVLLMNVQVSW